MRPASVLGPVFVCVAAWPGLATAAELAPFGCADCLVAAPEPHAGRRPLLVALHGDNAAAYHKKFARSLAPAAERAKMVLFAPRCPVASGCTAGSWWQWLAAKGHDAGWLEARIGEVAARFDVDPKRVYAVGYSGGATYLGWYAPTHPTAFAAVAHVSGGGPFRVACPATKYRTLFFIGATDPMIRPYTEPLRLYYEACGGHEVAWQALPGVSHEGMLDTLAAGGADRVIGWLGGATGTSR